MEYNCTTLDRITTCDECFDCPFKMKCDQYASMLDEQAERLQEQRSSDDAECEI